MKIDYLNVQSTPLRRQCNERKTLNTSRAMSGLPQFLAYTCLALSLLLQAQTCHATETENKNPPLEFVAEELPPLTFHSSGGADGLGADMVRELLRQ